MPEAAVSAGVSIAYETFGDPNDPSILLVMGLGAQLIAWHEDFCRELAGRGRHVIRYDNRDCGLSATFDDHPVDVARIIATVTAGDIAAAHAMIPYSSRTWPADGIGLLTALGSSRRGGREQRRRHPRGRSVSG